MGVHTMSGGGSGGGGALSRQGSVYSLTLNEVESHLGEPLRSMNLDDLLRTVLPAADPHAAGEAATAGKKTVDEVWRDIQSAGSGRQATTMGEMTLKDFLSRAGVAVDGGASAHWLRHYPAPPLQYVGRPVARPLGVGPAPVLDAVYRDGHGVAGFLSQVAGRKRGASAGADGVVEKTVERRQKRMIKNRESAARSRARKQAYTNELENKISRLEEENQRLREQKAVADFSTFPSCVDFLKAFLTQKLEPVMQIVPQPEPKQQLRRTNSASF
ncbi:ABSCISIC ACID-INSENSITIVE 5-like protein 3 [Oryza brachyantha]|uniref:ABSCISIC ACID-INSENSITIVE 5-like protein 3 n=1 Tax=Oryza brachyantha TaxID=4533 RepID=UPI001ADB9275|nr:ABSCISIC ACID-INSENSITIVE 5-like protein 3 [Oryza brachyantha]XP_040382156.1 ABSCISIC ACID-INSENSITIVE 5-like protein 3 [Oryza brachyantha]XP_040382157.1 ABSCISIC ACID-INSENSITIVE 5-like protein 3 [Oryza brachyantha]